jgi:hypothetical protein
MRKVLIVLLFLIFLLPGKAQQIFKPAITPFSKIEIYGSFDVEIRKANKEGVKMESETVDLTTVKCKVKNNTLKIKLIKELFNKDKQIKVLIEYNNLESILVSNGATLMSKEPIVENKLQVIEGNGSKVDFLFKGETFETAIDKGAVLNIEGSCQTADIEASTGAIVNGYEFQCDSAVVRANASGLIKIAVTKYLDARASTGGDVSYRGIPRTFKQRTSMGGSIEKVMEYNSSPSH